MANNENRNSNQQQYNKDKFSPENILKDLTYTSIQLPIAGVEYIDTTDSIANKVVDMIDAMGIHEIDHCLINPARDRNTNELIGFDVVLYFNTRKGNPNNRTIYRVGVDDNRRDGNRVNLMSIIGSRTTNGNFDITSEFKKAIAPFANLDNNGNIVIMGTDMNPDIAVIECKFFDLMTVALGIESNDCYDYTIADCTPVNNRNDCINYRLVIIKEVIPEANRRRNKSGINYDVMDRKRINRRRGNRY